MAQREPRAIEKLVLDNRIEAKDIRAIFAAVNHDGRLNSIAATVNASTDTDLEKLGKLLTRYLYQEADLPEGFPALLRERIRRKSFSDVESSVKNWSAEPDFSRQLRAVRQALRWDKTPELVTRDVGLIGDEFTEAVFRARDNSDATYRESRDYPRLVEAPTGREMVVDLKNILGNKALTDRIVTDVSILPQKFFGTAILTAAVDLRKERGTDYFEGLGYRVAEMLRTKVAFNDLAKNQWDLVLKFAETTNTNSKKLFTVLEKSIKENPEQAFPLEEKFQQFADAAVAGAIRDRLDEVNWEPKVWIAIRSDGKEGPSAEFNQLVAELRTAIFKFAPRARLNEVNLNSFALAKWIEAAVQANKEFFGKVRNEKFWQTNISLETQFLSFIDGKGKLVGDWEKQFTEPELKKWWPNFKNWLLNGKATDHQYKLTGRADVSFSEQLQLAVTTANATNLMLDAGGSFKSILYRITHPDPSSLLTLKELETDNLLDTFNRLLRTASIKEYRAIAKVIFEDLGFSDLAPEVKRTVLNVFEKDGSPELMTMLSRMLDSVSAVQLLDVSVDNKLPTPLEFYRAALESSVSKHIGWASRLLSLASFGNFFGLKEDEETALFPAIYKLFAQGRSVSKTLHFLGSFSEEEVPLFVQVFDRSFKGNGVRLHREFLDWFFANVPTEGIESLVSKVDREGWNTLPSLRSFPPAERRLVTTFVDRQDHLLIWDFLRNNTSEESLRAFVAELKNLTRSGDLRHACGVLSYLRDDRVARLALLFREWIDSGEFLAFLNIGEMLLKP